MINLGKTGFNDSHIHGLSCDNVLAHTPSTFITKTQLFKFVKDKEGGWVGGALGGSERPTGVEVGAMGCMMGSDSWNCGHSALCFHHSSTRISLARRTTITHPIHPIHVITDGKAMKALSVFVAESSTGHIATGHVIGHRLVSEKVTVVPSS